MHRDVHDPAVGRALSHDPRAGRTRPFRIEVDQEVLDDLDARLARTRWTTVADVDSWSHGTSPAYLRELVRYWQTEYDWRRHEVRLNMVPRYTALVDDTELSFGRAGQPGAMPLVLLHGWPDSFDRYHKMIPRLAGSFDIVVPALPGFPFGGEIRTRGTRHTAELVWRLMTEVLGFETFALAGGDGGSAIAQLIAIDHPSSVVGIHLTDLGWHVANVDPATLSKPEQHYLAERNKRFMVDGAYAMVHSTTPLSIAPALLDSPIGLASWIVDRFHAWADGGLEARFTKDELLTDIMLYWVTQTIGSSIYTYFADARAPSLTPADRVERPVAVALFPADIGGMPPRQFAERTLNVVRWTEMARGGHFAALEEPELYARDLIEFFRTLANRIQT